MLEIRPGVQTNVVKIQLSKCTYESGILQTCDYFFGQRSGLSRLCLIRRLPAERGLCIGHSSRKVYFWLWLGCRKVVVVSSYS